MLWPLKPFVVVAELLDNGEQLVRELHPALPGSLETKAENLNKSPANYTRTRARGRCILDDLDEILSEFIDLFFDFRH